MTYDPVWLPQLAALARAHGRLVQPRLALTDGEVARGLERHAFWPFYSPGLATGETLLAVEGPDLLAAAQTGFVDHGWGYGALAGDGPDWLYDQHLSLFWLFAWPAGRPPVDAAAALVGAVVRWARSQGLPGLEAFRGGPGFLPFGTQLSTFWPHLWAPLRAGGFRQPRDLLVYSGETAPESLPAPPEPPEGLELQSRRGRLEARLDGRPVGLCVAGPLSADRQAGGRSEAPWEDPRASTWAVIRRLVVDEATRGRGVGAALFAAQLRQLHRQGVTRYLLHAPDDPEQRPAHALYSTFGSLVDRQQVLRLSF